MTSLSVPPLVPRSMILAMQEVEYLLHAHENGFPENLFKTLSANSVAESTTK